MMSHWCCAVLWGWLKRRKHKASQRTFIPTSKQVSCLGASIRATTILCWFSTPGISSWPSFQCLDFWEEDGTCFKKGLLILELLPGWFYIIAFYILHITENWGDWIYFRLLRLYSRLGVRSGLLIWNVLVIYLKAAVIGYLSTKCRVRILWQVQHTVCSVVDLQTPFCIPKNSDVMKHPLASSNTGQVILQSIHELLFVVLIFTVSIYGLCQAYIWPWRTELSNLLDAGRMVWDWGVAGILPENSIEIVWMCVFVCFCGCSLDLKAYSSRACWVSISLGPVHGDLQLRKSGMESWNLGTSWNQ